MTQVSASHLSSHHCKLLQLAFYHLIFILLLLLIFESDSMIISPLSSVSLLFVFGSREHVIKGPRPLWDGNPALEW